MAISGFLAVCLAGLSIYLRHEAARAEAALERAKRDYGDMVRMKRAVDEFRKNAPRTPLVEKGGEDLLQLLGPKARQAGIPQNMLTITRNPDRKEGVWKEISYTVTLRPPAKDAVVPRASVVDFLGLVERERPAVKAKNLVMAFSGRDFSSVSVTFSTFQRESP